MIVIAFEDIRFKYNDVVKECKESGQPIRLTENGQSELIVMDIASFERREQELRAQQLVLEAFAARLAGGKEHSIEQSKCLIDKMI